MKKKKRECVTLTSLEKRCLMKFFLKEAPVFFKNCDNRTRHLGIEKAFEEVEKEAECEKPTVKVIAHDLNNFTIMFDEKKNGRFSPLFIMKQGFEVVVEDEDKK